MQPAIVNSVYDKRIVGCPGGEGGELLIFLNSITILLLLSMMSLINSVFFLV